MTDKNPTCNLCGRTKQSTQWCEHFQASCICLYLVCAYCTYYYDGYDELHAPVE